MKKLWKVTVNQWGWDSPQTFYYESREEAEKDSAKYPASDGVEYAGQFTNIKADLMTGKLHDWDVYRDAEGKLHRYDY